MNRNVDVARAFAAIMSAVLFSMIFAFLASSCSENGVSGDTPVEKTAKLQLVVTGTSASSQSRATDSTLPTSEDNIKTLAVGVFNADGSVNSIYECEPTNIAEKVEMYCTPGKCDVVVVANAPKGTFDAVQTKTEFQNKTVLLSQTAASDVQKSDNLPMSGQQTAITLSGSATTPVTIQLSRLVARISISSIKTAFSGENASATFELDKVFLCNVLSASKVAPGDEITATFPTTPQWLNSDDAVMSGGTWSGEKYLLEEIAGVTLSASNSTYSVPCWFYAFANNAEQHRTKLVIAGNFDPKGDGHPVYVYYPITVNYAQTGTSFEGDESEHNGTISRNRDYKIRATIAKKGVSSPDEDIVQGELQLELIIADWKLEIIQDVTIE